MHENHSRCDVAFSTSGASTTNASADTTAAAVDAAAAEAIAAGGGERLALVLVADVLCIFAGA